MKKNKRNLLWLMLILLFTCMLVLIISIYSIMYNLTPKNYISYSTRLYYANKAYDYFDKKEVNSVSINTLINEEYANEKKELKEYNCNLKDSFVLKSDKNYYVYIKCENFTATLQAIDKEAEEEK